MQSAPHREPGESPAHKAVRRVGTENYIAAMVAIPVLSLAFEAVAAALGLLELTPVATRSTLFGAVMILGSLGVFWARATRWMPGANASPPNYGGVAWSKGNAT